MTGEILLVDDDPLLRMNNAEVLRDQGFAVTEADGLAAAAALCRGRVFALIVLDHDLGDGKGLELVERLDRSGDRTPIVYLSAAPESVLAGARGAGHIVEVLSKPVGTDALREAVARHLRDDNAAAPFPRLIGPKERDLLLDDFS